MSFENYKEVFDSQHWISIEKDVLEIVKPIISLGIKNKLVSELISEMTEKLAAKYFSKFYNSDKVRCAKNDNEPDIIFDNDKDCFKFAVYKVNLTKQDWIMSKVKNYYATIYNMNALASNPSHMSIVGDYTVSKRNNVKPLLASIT